MNKKDIIKTLDIASFVSAVIATILVLAFEFVGKYILMKYAIVMYAVCFLTLSVMLGINVYDKFKKQEINAEKQEQKSELKTTETEGVLEDNAEKIDKTETENVSERKKKIMSIVWFSVSVILFVFTCVLLVLY